MKERQELFFFFGKTIGSKAKDGDHAVKKRLSQIPIKYRRTLTRDRGSENMECKALQKELGMDIFFAHAHCSWEGGSNENCNGLFRRLFPKKTNFDTVSDEEIAQAEYLINSRPQKRLCGKTPYEVFYEETGVALDCWV